MGDVREREVDIALVAATHQNLAARVKDGAFRSDLYYRISSIPLTMPALRDRREDILPLAHTLLARGAADLNRGAVRLSADAERALQGYAWPGNIRELRNVIERAALLCDAGTISRRDLRFEPAPAAGGLDDESGLTLQEVERRHIERVLREEGGRVEPAAQRLGVPRSTLYQKIKNLGIDASQPAP